MAAAKQSGRHSLSVRCVPVTFTVRTWSLRKMQASTFSIHKMSSANFHEGTSEHQPINYVIVIMFDINAEVNIK
jgi:hypothetical protein